VDELLQICDLDATAALGEGVDAEDKHAFDDGEGSGFADACGVGADEVELELLPLGRTDGNVGEGAKPSRNAVDRPALVRHHVVDALPALLDQSPRLGSKVDGEAVSDDAVQLGEGEGPPVEAEHLSL
jgi:hypothetical protein